MIQDQKKRDVINISYTKQQLDEFDKLTRLMSSYDQLERIKGRVKLGYFIIENGKEVCDIMFNVLKEKDKKDGYKG